MDGVHLTQSNTRTLTRNYKKQNLTVEHIKLK